MVFCEAWETAFEVSLDGSLTRCFEDMEFIVSLPVIRGNGQSERENYIPKRGVDSSKSSSVNEDKIAGGGKGECSKGCSFQVKSSAEEVDREKARPLSREERVRIMEEAKRSFRERVAPHQPVNLMEFERKRKRNHRLEPPVRALELRIYASRSSLIEPPAVTAWPANPSALKKIKPKSVKPKFKVGDRVNYLNSVTYMNEGAGMITAVIQPGIEGYSPNDGVFRYEIDTNSAELS